MSSNLIQGYPRSYGSADFFIEDLGTAAFYGLEFIDTAEDLIIPNQNISCRPNVLIRGITMVIDYTNCGVGRDRDYIDATFTGMTSGYGFTFSNAFYDDAVNRYSANLSASCTLNNYADYKIVANSTTIGSTTETNYYPSRNFETVPQISTLAGLTTGATANELINYTTSRSTSFVSNNFVVGDYVDFSTTNNNGRFVIKGVTVDGWGRELITFSGTPITTPEDLRGLRVVVDHKRKVFLSTSNPYNVNDIVVHNVDVKAVGGKNYFSIDGTIQSDLVLTRGVMYIFVENNYPDATLTFSTTADGTHQGGSSYATVGMYTLLDTSLNRRLYFFVPNNNNPQQLYYYDPTTSGMGAGIKVAGSYAYGSAPTLAAGTATTTSTLGTSTY